MDDDCNQGKDDYSEIQYRALGARCPLFDAHDRVYGALIGALITITSYILLDTVQYIT